LLGPEQLCPLHHPGGTTGPPPPDTVGPDPTAARHIACSDAPLGVCWCIHRRLTFPPLATTPRESSMSCHYCIKNLVLLALLFLFDDELEILISSQVTCIGPWYMALLWSVVDLCQKQRHTHMVFILYYIIGSDKEK
jgi:hypothetical protein